jgi:homocysteine S-methyltransferase
MAASQPFLSDGGLETTLVFHDEIDLPDFAAFPLLDSEDGRQRLSAYFAPYLDIAEQVGTGFVLDTPTWRANPDWGTRLGYDSVQLADVNARAVGFIGGLAQARPGLPSVLNGVIGPRGDGYVVGTTMSVAEATDYHYLQARAFADAGADMVSAITMTYAEEATGVSLAACRVGLPVVISFTVETDRRLPSGQHLGDAINQVDEITDTAPAYFMINCAHPEHLPHDVLLDTNWSKRVRGIRANASSLSHAELDAATSVDRGNITDFAAHHAALLAGLDLCVIGGCCGTDQEHIAALAQLLPERRATLPLGKRVD